ncbi:MAG: hypothetical protein HFG49_03790 [Lachnospiraceae bacterium]|jgi:hypothetical protein|nr:hypothetical protein [Lachnospiraceae bacterium]
MEQSWKNDARLKNMDPRKLDLLILFSNRLAKTPKGQLLGEFVNLNVEAQSKGLQFTDQETSIITEILTESLPDSERKKLDTLRLLSKKLSRQT